MRKIETASFLTLCLSAAIAFAPVAASAQPEPVSVVVIESTVSPYSERLKLRGRTEAARNVEVKSEISGLIASPPLRKGAFVRAGETLCRIEQAERAAELTEAKARLIDAEANFAASSSLSKKGFSTEIRANAMEAALEEARARVLRAELNLSRLDIKAPFDGLLETDTAELGALLQNGSTCATLIALDPIKFVAYAPERTVDSLEVGAAVSARLITGEEIEGEISFVSRAADRDTRTYLVEAEAANADLAIRDGMTAEIQVSLKTRQAHFIPLSSLTLNDEGVLGVRLAVDGAARFASVDLLRDEPGGVWVAGLPDTVDLIVVGQEFVNDGAPVAVTYVEQERIQ